jgi:hypothetical protein
LPRLRTLLQGASGLAGKELDHVAAALNDMADMAADLLDIFRRLVDEDHTAAEVGELLIAFELTTEQLRGNSDVIDGKLYEIGDRLKALARKKTRPSRASTRKA